MTNQEQYELICEKAKKYDRLVGVLDKIRAEIEQLPTEKCTGTRRIYIDADDFKENVLAIFDVLATFDKYKAESEET